MWRRTRGWSHDRRWHQRLSATRRGSGVSCGATDARLCLSGDHWARLSRDSAVLVLTVLRLLRDGCWGCGASDVSVARDRRWVTKRRTRLTLGFRPLALSAWGHVARGERNRHWACVCWLSDKRYCVVSVAPENHPVKLITASSWVKCYK
jgi:hypothetical protein